MRLTLENAENKLIDLGLATRDEIEKQKEKRKFGQKECKILRRFRKAVKENYEDFFPEKPNMSLFKIRSERLFHTGGEFIFFVKTTIVLFK